MSTDPMSVPLAELADRYWAAALEADPLFATSIGERSLDARLSDRSPDAIARRRAILADLQRAAIGLDPASLSATDRITQSALLESLTGDLAAIDSGVDDWMVDPLEGPQVAFNNIESFQPIRTPDEGRAMVERWRAMAAWVDQHAANLRRSRVDGRVAVAEPVARVIDELDSLLGQPVDGWSLAAPAHVDHADWSPAEQDAFRSDLLAAARDGVAPAFERLRAVLVDEIAPAARPQEQAGLVHLDNGAEAYRLLIRAHTSLDLPAEEIHASGLREIERIDREFVELGRKVLGTTDLASTLGRLRDDRTLYFRTRDEVFDKAASALARANDAIDGWFGILPRAACEIVRIGPHEEKHSTLAYYRQPAADGSRPGQYFINTYEPESRPRYEAEALAYHEALPGHHLQIAIGQELPRLPDFRHHLGPTSFFEGWGLYTERLADEMSLYSSDMDRFGILSFDAWRACRLVVDTGMHALGWSREQSIDYMAGHTALSRDNIANEVDRYIVWPGQALAYKIGQLEILGLRADAEARLGARFDIRAFHDVVLGSGAVPIATLRALVSDYSRNGA